MSKNKTRDLINKSKKEFLDSSSSSSNEEKKVEKEKGGGGGKKTGKNKHFHGRAKTEVVGVDNNGNNGNNDKEEKGRISKIKHRRLKSSSFEKSSSKASKKKKKDNNSTTTKKRVKKQRSTTPSWSKGKSKKPSDSWFDQAYQKKTVADTFITQGLGTVSLPSVKLTSLEGLGYRVTMKSLFVQNNFLTSFKYLQSQPNLEELNLENNFITSFLGLEFQPKIKSLVLKGNPICSHPHYRLMCLMCVGKTIKTIDGESILAKEKEFVKKYIKLNPLSVEAVREGWLMDLKVRRPSEYEDIMQNLKRVNLDSREILKNLQPYKKLLLGYMKGRKTKKKSNTRNEVLGRSKSAIKVRTRKNRLRELAKSPKNSPVKMRNNFLFKATENQRKKRKESNKNSNKKKNEDSSSKTPKSSKTMKKSSSQSPGEKKKKKKISSAKSSPSPSPRIKTTTTTTEKSVEVSTTVKTDPSSALKKKNSFKKKIISPRNRRGSKKKINSGLQKAKIEEDALVFTSGLIRGFRYFRNNVNGSNESKDEEKIRFDLGGDIGKEMDCFVLIGRRHFRIFSLENKRLVDFELSEVEKTKHVVSKPGNFFKIEFFLKKNGKAWSTDDEGRDNDEVCDFELRCFNKKVSEKMHRIIGMFVNNYRKGIRDEVGEDVMESKIIVEDFEDLSGSVTTIIRQLDNLCNKTVTVNEKKLEGLVRVREKVKELIELERKKLEDILHVRSEIEEETAKHQEIRKMLEIEKERAEKESMVSKEMREQEMREREEEKKKKLEDSISSRKNGGKESKKTGDEENEKNEKDNDDTDGGSSGGDDNNNNEKKKKKRGKKKKKKKINNRKPSFHSSNSFTGDDLGEEKLKELMDLNNMLEKFELNAKKLRDSMKKEVKENVLAKKIIEEKNKSEEKMEENEDDDEEEEEETKREVFYERKTKQESSDEEERGRRIDSESEEEIQNSIVLKREMERKKKEEKLRKLEEEYRKKEKELLSKLEEQKQRDKNKKNVFYGFCNDDKCRFEFLDDSIGLRFTDSDITIVIKYQDITGLDKEEEGEIGLDLHKVYFQIETAEGSEYAWQLDDRSDEFENMIVKKCSGEGDEEIEEIEEMGETIQDLYPDYNGNDGLKFNGFYKNKNVLLIIGEDKLSVGKKIEIDYLEVEGFDNNQNKIIDGKLSLDIKTVSKGKVRISLLENVGLKFQRELIEKMQESVELDSKIKDEGYPIKSNKKKNFVKVKKEEIEIISGDKKSILQKISYKEVLNFEKIIKNNTNRYILTTAKGKEVFEMNKRISNKFQTELMGFMK